MAGGGPEGTGHLSGSKQSKKIVRRRVRRARPTGGGPQGTGHAQGATTPRKGPSPAYPSPHLQKHRQDKAAQVAARPKGGGPQGTGKMAPRVTAHLIKHRKDKAAQQQQRPGGGPEGTGHLPDAKPSLHLIKHRQHKAEQQARERQVSDLRGVKPLAKTPPSVGIAYAKAKVNKGPSVEDVVKPFVSPVGAALGIKGKDVVHEAKKIVSKVNPGQDLPSGVQSALYPGSQGRAKQAIEHDLPEARKAVQKKLELGKKVSPRDQLTGGPGGVPGGAQTAQNLAKDATQLPEMAVGTGYAAAKAGVEAVKGNTKPAEELAKGLSEGFVGNLVKGKPGKAIKYAEDHPGFAALEIAGVKSGLGRGTGAVTRNQPFSKKLRKATSTDRAPRHLGGGQVQTQHYSKDLFNQAGQKIAEKVSRKVGDKPEPKFSTPAAGARNVVRSAREARNVHERNKTVSVEHDTGLMVERTGRTKVKRKVAQTAPVRKHPRPAPAKGIRRASPIRAAKKAANLVERSRLQKRPEQEVVDLIGRGQVRAPHAEADLRKIHDRLQAKTSSLRGADKHENKRTIKNIRSVLDDPKAIANLPAAFESAKQVAPMAKKISAQRVKQGIETVTQSERRQVLPYAIEHMDLKDEGGKFVGPRGETVPTKAIKAHMRRNGTNPDHVFFMSGEHENAAAAHYQSPMGSRGRGDSTKRFSGKSVELGTGPSGYKALTTEMVRQHGSKGHVAAWDNFVGRVALKGTNGKAHVGSFNRVNAVADDIREATNGKTDLVPIRLHAAQHSARQEKILGLQDVNRTPSDIIQRASSDDAPPLPHEKGQKIWGLAPRHQMKRLKDLENVGSSGAGKGLRAVTHQFTRTVLPFSVKWFFGNSFEAGLRSAIAGVSPHDPIVGKRVVAEMLKQDRAAGEKLQAIVGNRGFYGVTLKRMGTKHPDGGIARVIAKVRNAPAIKQAFDGLHNFQNGIMHVNTSIENAAGYGALGKFARREMQEMTDNWAKATVAQGDLVRQLVEERFLNPAKVQEFGHYVDELLGQYRRFSPEMQRIIQNFAPFLPWWLNSVRFVYWTMPAHHPLLTALLTKTEATLQDEWKRQHKNAPPGDLQSAIAQGPNKFTNLAHFTPWGAFTGRANGLENVPDIVLPQISSAVHAAAGQTFFGKEIKDLSDGERAALVLNAFVTSYVPGASIYKTIKEGGHSATEESTVFRPKGKKESHYQSPGSRIFNPLRPTYTGNSKKKGDFQMPSTPDKGGFKMPGGGKSSDFKVPGG